MGTIPALRAAPAILPPFTGTDPTEPESRSPYLVGIEEVVRRFATTKKRAEILKGLLSYRKELRQLQLGAEFQWLAGSFVEDPGREPRDVDVVTFYQLTSAQIASLRKDDGRWGRFQDLGREAKARFLCDAYHVNMAGVRRDLVSASHYWYGLFSHQRGSLAWKGMLEVEMASADDDQQAEEMLAAMVIP
jgi:uncharacterized protein DUF6932